MNKKIAAGVVAGLLAGGAAGVALGMPALSGAQESPSTTAPAEQAPADGATAPAADAARPDRAQWMQDALAPLVQDGTITQTQADAVIAALDAAKPERGGPHGGMRGGPGRGLDAAATAIGVTQDELRTALQGGQTIAEVAQSKGVDPQAVVDAMVAEMKAHLDAEVTAGEHTQAEADQILADATQRITDLVNGQLPAGGPGGMGGPGMGGRGHGQGFGPGGDDDASGTDGSGSTGTSA